MNRKWICSVILSACMVLSTSVAMAADYPTRPIQIVAAYAAGGATDQISRIVAAVLPDILGQPAVVLNKPGSGGVVGTAWAASQKPDGHTLFMGSPGPIITQSLMTQLPYSRKDFIPIATLCYFPTVVGVLPSSPYKTWKDVENAAKKAPNSITYCTSGFSATGSVLMHGLELEANIKLKFIPDNGCPECLRSVLGGHRDLYVCEPYNEGLRYIGNFAPERSPKRYPDVPTFKEMGYSTWRITWYVLATQKGTPPEIVAKLRDAAKKVFEHKSFESMLQGIAAEPYFVDGAKTEAMWESDYQNTLTILEKSGMKYKQEKK